MPSLCLLVLPRITCTFDIITLEKEWCYCLLNKNILLHTSLSLCKAASNSATLNVRLDEMAVEVQEDR